MALGVEKRKRWGREKFQGREEALRPREGGRARVVVVAPPSCSRRFFLLFAFRCSHSLLLALSAIIPALLLSSRSCSAGL